MVPPTLAVAAETEPAAAAEAPISQEKLDSLLAPIALYPDQLLTQALMASTYPLDVVEAARFIKDNKELKGEELDKVVAGKNWDPSVQSLTAFPQVLEMMNDKLEWTQELGNAFLADEKRVLQTVQNLRQKADAAGNLQSNEQQKVVKEQSVIIIEPAKPDVVYVPTYNPTIVYGTWWAPMYPPYYWPPPAYYYPPGSMLVAGAIGFGIGMAISNNHWGWCNAGWHGGNVNINVNRNNTFINNNANFKKNVNNGNWNHNPSQRKGVAYGDAKTRDQFRKSDPNAAASRRDARGFESGSRDAQRAGSTGPRDMQRPGGGGDSQFGGSASTRDAKQSWGGGDSQFGGGAGTRDTQRSGGGDFGQSSGTKPSFNASQSRQQTQNYSNRGASSRSSMGGGGRSGGRSGGGGRGR
ncbi:MAG: DUF3300 domain-containing protein [Thiobacillus sp.]|nr:DUF3300 domain-containing protein [Thiobacillus sp.]